MPSSFSRVFDSAALFGMTWRRLRVLGVEKKFKFWRSTISIYLRILKTNRYYGAKFLKIAVSFSSSCMGSSEQDFFTQCPVSLRGFVSVQSCESIVSVSNCTCAFFLGKSSAEQKNKKTKLVLRGCIKTISNNNFHPCPLCFVILKVFPSVALITLPAPKSNWCHATVSLMKSRTVSSGEYGI